MKKTQKTDHRIMDILKVHEVSRIICDTNMGTLKLKLKKGETEYKFILDAVELPKETNKELMEALYKPDEADENAAIEPKNKPGRKPKVI